MQSDKEWSLISFGHGLFQECVLKPLLFQSGSAFTQDSTTVFNSDQSSIIGVEVTPSPQFTGGLDGFISQFEKNLYAVDFGVQINLKSTFEDVTREISYKDFSPLDVDCNFAGMKMKHVITSTGLLIYFDSVVKVSPQYMYCPLVVTLNLNVQLTQGKPFNQRLKMDSNESNVRLLLDLNRYRPTRIPTRKIQIPLQLQHPMKVSVSYTRELDARTTLVSINIRNNHHNRPLQCHDVVLHLERTLLNTGVTPSTGSSKPRKPLRQSSSTGSEKSQRSVSLAGDSDEETNNNNNKDRLMKSGANAQRTHKQSRVFTSLPVDFHAHLQCCLLRAPVMSTLSTAIDSSKATASFIISPGESYSLVYQLSYSHAQTVSVRVVTPVTLTWSLLSLKDATQQVDTVETNNETSTMSALCMKLLQPEECSDDEVKKVVSEEVPYEHQLEWTLGLKNSGAAGQ